MDVLADCRRAPRPAGGGRRRGASVRTRCSPCWSRGCGTASASACRRADDQRETAGSRSLVPLMPLLLGDRLPGEIRARLVEIARSGGDPHPSRPRDREPVEPALSKPTATGEGRCGRRRRCCLSTGCDACGEHELAADIARRFLETCRRSGLRRELRRPHGPSAPRPRIHLERECVRGALATGRRWAAAAAGPVAMTAVRAVPAPVRLTVVGAGSRGTIYASWAREHPDRATVVAVVDPRDACRERMAAAFDVPPAQTWSDWRQLAAIPRIADAVVTRDPGQRARRAGDRACRAGVPPPA